MKTKIHQWKIDKDYCIMHTKLLHNILYYRFYTFYYMTVNIKVLAIALLHCLRPIADWVFLLLFLMGFILIF